MHNVLVTMLQRSASAGKGEHSRHHKKRSRSRDGKYDEYVETPVTRVLREVPDDILDTPRPSVYGAQQHAYYGDLMFLLNCYP